MLVARLIDSRDEQRGLDYAEHFRRLVLPWVPPHVPTNIARRTAAGHWPRVRTSSIWRALHGHLTGGPVIGGVHVQVQTILVQDLDAAGEIPLETRLHVARLVQPRSLVLRSSASGGLHVLSAFATPQPIQAVLHLAAERLRKAAATISRELFERLAAAPLEGVSGLYELHPRAWPQGSVIRVPLGPGSYVLDEQLQPRHSTAIEGIRLLVDWLHLNPPAQTLDQAFPHDDLARLLIPPPPALAGGARTSRPGPLHGPAATSWPADDLTRFARCHGALPVGDRGTLDDARAVVERILENGLPAESTRQRATFDLAYVAVVGNRLSPDDAKRWVWSVLETRAPSRSKDVRLRPTPTKRRTDKIVDGYYRRRLDRTRAARPFRLISGGRRYRAPQPVNLSDWLHTLNLFDHDGFLCATWLRILQFVRANRFEPTPGSGYWVCDLPLELLRLRDRRSRRALDTFIRMRLLVPYRKPVPLGPGRTPRAAVYRCRWRFLAVGPEVTAPRPLSAAGAVRLRAKLHVLSLQLGEKAQQFVNPAPAAGVSGGPADEVEPARAVGEAVLPPSQSLLGPVTVESPAHSLFHPLAADGRDHSCASHPPPQPTPSDQRASYLQAVLQLRTLLPGARPWASPHDRDAALELYRRHVPFAVVETAVLLSTIRLLLLTDGLPPRIGSLRYCLGAVQEVLPLARNTECLHDYRTYLRRRAACLFARPPELVLHSQSAHPVTLRQYTTRLLNAWASLPRTPSRPKRQDRAAIARYYRQGVPIDLLEDALVLATARRMLRRTQPPLPPVRSFAYYRGTIHELLTTPRTAAYCAWIHHLREVLRDPARHIERFRPRF